MSARPDVFRPFTQRKGPNTARTRYDGDLYSARNQFMAIKNSQDSLTTDDIVNLKREKQNLIHERSILKAKLARYANFNRHSKAPRRNQQIANSLERQVNTLEQLTAAKRAEIAQLIYSDRAAVITELQEESKMLHLELMRLRRAKGQTEHELNEVSAQLEEASQKYSPAVINRQDRTIKRLEKEIEEQREKNEQIRQKVEQVKTEKTGSARQEADEKVQKEIDALRQKIKREQKEIASIDRQMDDMRKAHADEMQELQSQL